MIPKHKHAYAIINTVKPTRVIFILTLNEIKKNKRTPKCLHAIVASQDNNPSVRQNANRITKSSPYVTYIPLKHLYRTLTHTNDGT